MVDVQQLRSMDDLEAILSLSESQPVLVFKHSTSCGTSLAVHRDFRQYLISPEAVQGVAHALVRVIEERPISMALAQALGVPHQSPQMILIRNRQAVWHDSHWRLTAETMKEAVRTQI